MASRWAQLGSSLGGGLGGGFRTGMQASMIDKIQNSPDRLLAKLLAQAQAFEGLEPSQVKSVRGFRNLTEKTGLMDIIGTMLASGKIGGLGGGGRLGGGQGGGQVGGGSPQQPPIPTGAQDIVPLGIYSMPDGSELIPQDQADVDEILKIGGRRKQ